MLLESLFLRGVNKNGNMQPWIIASTVAVTVLALLSVILRFTARWTRGASIGVDDYLILSSMVSR